MQSLIYQNKMKGLNNIVLVSLFWPNYSFSLSIFNCGILFSHLINFDEHMILIIQFDDNNKLGDLTWRWID